MKAALDTNVLVHAEARDGSPRSRRATDLVALLPPRSTVISVLALAEMYSVLVRKAQRPRAEAREALERWHAFGVIRGVEDEDLASAAEVAVRHRLSIWDAVHLITASRAGCELFLSEDMQDGFRWGGLQVVNPFPDARWRWLAARWQTGS